MFNIFRKATEFESNWYVQQQQKQQQRLWFDRTSCFGKHGFSTTKQNIIFLASCTYHFLQPVFFGRPLRRHFSFFLFFFVSFVYFVCRDWKQRISRQFRDKRTRFLNHISSFRSVHLCDCVHSHVTTTTAAVTAKTVWCLIANFWFRACRAQCIVHSSSALRMKIHVAFDVIFGIFGVVSQWNRLNYVAVIHLLPLMKSGIFSFCFSRLLFLYYFIINGWIFDQHFRVIFARSLYIRLRRFLIFCCLHFQSWCGWPMLKLDFGHGVWRTHGQKLMYECTCFVVLTFNFAWIAANLFVDNVFGFRRVQRLSNAHRCLVEMARPAFRYVWVAVDLWMGWRIVYSIHGQMDTICEDMIINGLCVGVFGTSHEQNRAVDRSGRRGQCAQL